MGCRYLYFEDSNGKQHKISKRSISQNGLDKAIREDLAKRRPGSIIFYMKYSELEDGGLWIDFGSHTEFYFWK